MWLPILTPAKAVYNVCRLPLVQKVACKLYLWWLYFLKKNSRTSIDYLLRIIPPPSSFPSRHFLFLNDEAEVQSDQEKPISDDLTLYAENKHVTILFFFN